MQQQKCKAWPRGRKSGFGRVGESELHKSCPLCGLLRRPERRSAASLPGNCLKARFKNTRGSVFAQKALWRGSPQSGQLLICSDSTRKHPPSGAVTEAQRSQRAFCAKTLPPSLKLWRTSRAAVLLAATFVGSALQARCGDSRASPPRLRPKSLAAEPLVFLKHALKLICARVLHGLALTSIP